MAKPKLITMTTDFGTSDPYVGIMKGVIARVNPKIQVIDLSHQVSPQNVMEAGFVLLDAFPFFPKGSVHLAVVDPGVGSQRKALAIRLKEGFLVGPDNGIFSGVLRQSPPIAVVELTETRFWRTSEPSLTFHGRDIFATVAAHLANGAAVEKMGPSVDPASLMVFPKAPLVEAEESLEGVIERIDRFGNLISNIPGCLVARKKAKVQLKGNSLDLTAIYADRPPGTLISLVGSHQFLEIAVVNGNAKVFLHAGIGEKIRVLFEENSPISVDSE